MHSWYEPKRETRWSIPKARWNLVASYLTLLILAGTKDTHPTLARMAGVAFLINVIVWVWSLE